MKAIIVDEAHHAAAPSYVHSLIWHPIRLSYHDESCEYSYRSILSHFHPDIKGPENGGPRVPPPRPVPILGFSATFSRHDGLALGSVFERIVYHRDFLEMIKEQWYVAFFPYLLTDVYVGQALRCPLHKCEGQDRPEQRDDKRTKRRLQRHKSRLCHKQAHNQQAGCAKLAGEGL